MCYFCIWCRGATFPRWPTGNDAFYSVLPDKEKGGGRRALPEATWQRTRRSDQEVQKWIALQRKGLPVRQKVYWRRERVTKGEDKAELAPASLFLDGEP